MSNISVTTNQQVIDVTNTSGISVATPEGQTIAVTVPSSSVNVTNTTDDITVLTNGTLNIITGITDRLIAGSNQVILNTNATMTFPNNVIDFGSQTADLKSSSYSELWYRNATATPPPGQGIQTYIWAWENQAGIAVESVDNGYKEWFFNADATTQFPNYKFPAADGTANQILKTNGSGVLAWYSPSDLNTTYTIDASTATGGANLNLVGSDATTDTVKFASGTNITVSRTDANTITIDGSDLNTTYTIASAATSGGANLTLTGSDSSTDSVAYKGAGATTVTSTDANTVTISSTDTNTTYTQNASSTTGGANLNLVGSDATTDTVKFANGTGITVVRTDADTITITNTVPDTNTTYTQNFSAVSGGANLNLVGSDSTTDTVKFADGTGVTVTRTDADTATIAIGQSVATTDAVTFSSVNIDGRALLDTLTLTTSATTPNQVLDSFTAATYRTAKYLISVSSGTDYQSVELLVVHNGTTASQTTYADVMTNTNLATFTVDISGGLVRLLTTPANAVTVYKVTRTAIVV